MSFRNLFKNMKSKSGRDLYAKDFAASSKKPLLNDQLSLISKPSNLNVIATDYDTKYSPSMDTPMTPFVDNTSMPETIFCDDTPAIITQHGYEFIQLIRNTSQGQIYKARKDNQTYAIKIVNKQLFHQKKCKNNSILTSKNILKHALLLNHCTVTNKAPGNHIAQFIDFFNDDICYYLVMEYCGPMTLEQWTEQAFKYIQTNKLDIKEYRKMVKFIFWQLSVLMYWLHNDMNICHLNITMKNIMVLNGEFTEGENGMINISRKLNIKLCDFDMSEIFKTGNYIGKSMKHDFDCSKKDGLFEYSLSNVFKIDIYDARKADIWAMGLLLYRLTFNEYPINFSTVKDSAICAIKANQLDLFIEENKLNKYCTDALIELIGGLLNYNEKSRFDALNILQCTYMNAYWQRYRIRITKKSFAQRAQLKTEWQSKMMAQFPYYL